MKPEGYGSERYAHGYKNAKEFIDLYWKENLWPLLKNGKHGDAIAQGRWMYAAVIEYKGKNDEEYQIVKDALGEYYPDLAEKQITIREPTEEDCAVLGKVRVKRKPQYEGQSRPGYECKKGKRS